MIHLGGTRLMTICDLCGESKECSKREIEGMEYDVCAVCWTPLTEKLKGKGRVKKEREMVLLPPLQKEPQAPPNLRPGEPPKIWGSADRVQ
jgi:hypothetical protein